MENIISVKKLRENLSVYADQIKKGQSFIVFKKSEPLFKLSPVEGDVWEEAIDFTKIKKGGVDVKDLLSRL
ncbi:MAG: hypothetical protein PHE77_03300 [Candidatus Pacebacteria bacterium]|nr:hypothetical protein [Candidatus Paceibacterota bacterium]